MTALFTAEQFVASLVRLIAQERPLFYEQTLTPIGVKGSLADETAARMAASSWRFWPKLDLGYVRFG